MGTAMTKQSFGQIARSLRFQASLGLREAAKKMGISAAYLSQVEKDIDDPSPRLMAAMATHYNRPLEEIRAAGERAGIGHRVPRAPVGTVEELRALYRIGAMFTPAEVESMLRHVLKERGVGDEEIERELAKLRADLPRIRNGGGDGLFAPRVRPRFLSKQAVASLAYRVLAKNGFDRTTYEPPTRLELIVEGEQGVSYTIGQLPSAGGDPVVLGLSRWSGEEREIIISTQLADGTTECDEHRFRFTLAHEFFHAIEHLPLLASRGATSRGIEMNRAVFVDRVARRTGSAAERAVEQWARADRPRGLLTPEDWREWQANTFASALLMPGWAVTGELRDRLGADEVCVPADKNVRQEALRVAGDVPLGRTFYSKSLAQVFGVSRQAMAIRLLDLRLLTEVKNEKPE